MARKKTDHEAEYFLKQEQEKLDRLRKQQDAAKKAAALDERRKAHFHKCGKCGADMDTQVYKGVEIEVCPECGSVLLDPGELQELAGEDRSGFSGMLGDLFSFGKK